MGMPGPAAPPAADVGALLERLSRTWQADDLPTIVEVRFSDRLTHNFGHCIPADNRVTIARRLLAFPEVFAEVLTHEVAHLESWRRHAGAAHHGLEWAALMCDAGYEPRRSLPPLPGDPPTTSRPTRYYRHHCPLCAAERVARRPVHRWRCVACHSAGRDGLLQITRIS